MTDEYCSWNGASGATYIFYIYQRPPNVPSRLGNYIYARLTSEKLWVPVYIGHGDLAVCSENDAALIACIDAKGATHLHMRLSLMETERLGVHGDLLSSYKNTFPPDGCNPPEDAPASPSRAE